MLHGKKIVVALSGGIAAYKTPLLVRLLVKAGAEVCCVATPHALQFVTPLTLETVSQHKVYHDLFAPANDHSTEHIALKEWADMVVVAPATANVIGKLASGIADDALSTLLVSCSQKPVVMCPAMNTQMLHCPAVQRNIATLKSDGIHFINSESGELACGTVGDGRMAEPDTIAHAVQQLLTQEQDYEGRTVIITAGPTYEKIDSVRFIGNFSTGKMGFALAEVLAQRGATVQLIAGPTHLSIDHPRIHRTDITSAQEMYDAATRLFPHCDAAILSAAVADFRPDHCADHKIKKQSDSDTMSLTLVQNPDILASLGRLRQPHQRLVGFALETDNETANAKEKIAKKNLDFIVLNSLRDSGAGFGHNTNKVTLIDRDGTTHTGSLKSKHEVAHDIADHLRNLLPST